MAKEKKDRLRIKKNNSWDTVDTENGFSIRKSSFGKMTTLV